MSSSSDRGLNPDGLDAYEILIEGATKGPWRAVEPPDEYEDSHVVSDGYDGPGEVTVAGCHQPPNDAGAPGSLEVQGWDDARFIAAYRTWAPVLLAEVRRLQALVDAQPPIPDGDFTVTTGTDDVTGQKVWLCDGARFAQGLWDGEPGVGWEANAAHRERQARRMRAVAAAERATEAPRVQQ